MPTILVDFALKASWVYICHPLQTRLNAEQREFHANLPTFIEYIRRIHFQLVGTDDGKIANIWDVDCQYQQERLRQWQNSRCVFDHVNNLLECFSFSDDCHQPGAAIHPRMIILSKTNFRAPFIQNEIETSPYNFSNWLTEWWYISLGSSEETMKQCVRGEMAPSIIIREYQPLLWFDSTPTNKSEARSNESV